MLGGHRDDSPPEQRVKIVAGAVGLVAVAELDATQITLASVLPGVGAPKPSRGPDGGGSGLSQTVDPLQRGMECLGL